MNRLLHLIAAHIKILIFYLLVVFLPSIVSVMLVAKLVPQAVSFSYSGLYGLIVLDIIIIILVHGISFRLLVPRFFHNPSTVSFILIIHSLIIFFLLPSFYLLKDVSDFRGRRQEEESLWRKYADQYLGAVKLSDFRDELTQEIIDGEPYVKLRILATMEVSKEGKYQFYYRLNSGLAYPQ